MHIVVRSYIWWQQDRLTAVQVRTQAPSGPDLDLQLSRYWKITCFKDTRNKVMNYEFLKLCLMKFFSVLLWKEKLQSNISNIISGVREETEPVHQNSKYIDKYIDKRFKKNNRFLKFSPSLFVCVCVCVCVCGHMLWMWGWQESSCIALP